MGASRVDKIYRSIVLNRFFSRGWGSPENLKRLFDFRKIISQREVCLDLVDKNHPIIVDKVADFSKNAKIVDGHFTSPFAKCLPGLLPPASETSYFQLVVPKEWRTPERPIVIHMAGTGDHYFWRRRTLLAKPLLQENHVGSLIIENPFYGLRKPEGQYRSSLFHVSDIFTMGGALMMEAIALLRWLENEGYGPFCFHGISMGGHMASLAATNWSKPASVAPCLSWTTASGVFTRGVMSGAIDWDCLEQQFISDERFQKELVPMVFNSDVYVNDGKPGKIPATTSDLKSTLLRLLSSSYVVLPEWVSPIMPGKLASNVNELIKTHERWIQEKLQSKDKRLQARLEALTFMHAIMDECTHLKNYAVPVDTELVSVVAARNDAYVLRDDCSPMEEVWPGCTVNYTNCGHISAFVLYQVHFRHAIVNSLNLLRAKYNLDGTRKTQVPLGSATNSDLKNSVKNAAAAAPGENQLL